MVIGVVLSVVVVGIGSSVNTVVGKGRRMLSHALR